MEEKKLTVTSSGTYKNIKINEQKTVEVDGETLKTDKFLLDGGFIVVEKLFDKMMSKEGKFGPYWIARAKYGDEEVSFFINRKVDADAFDNLGAVGDKIKITGESAETQTGKKFLKLSFELL